jgi:hypothetical protein
LLDTKLSLGSTCVGGVREGRLTWPWPCTRTGCAGCHHAQTQARTITTRVGTGCAARVVMEIVAA